jgi:hypothetical protein
MARPRKEGMEYFPHDTDARNDLKIRKLRAVFGNDGYTTYFILLENIYRNKTYSIDISDAETMLILAEECKISEEKLSQIILKCCDLDLFNKQLYQENNTLTSEAIKKRTEPIENKRKKNNESYNSSKVEVSDAETIAEIEVSDAEKGAESTQSKGKKRKVNNIKNIICDYSSNEELQSAIEDFINMRKQIKKPMTDRAVILLLKNLDKLATNDSTKIEVLNQSIQNSWQGIFELKDNNSKGVQQQTVKANSAAYEAI